MRCVQARLAAGTIGVRGTAFDFYVGPDGTTAVVLLNGAAQFCGPGGCRQLTQRCDCVVAKRNGAMTDVRPVDRNVLDTLGTARALPFLSGNQRLSGMLGTSCGMTAALRDRRRPVLAPVEHQRGRGDRGQGLADVELVGQP